MTKDRISFRNELVKHLPKDAKKNIYFDPPETTKLSYPCIIYHEQPPSVKGANNSHYVTHTAYRVTVIDKDPERQIAKEIDQTFKHSRIITYFTTQGLRHSVIEIFW